MKDAIDKRDKLLLSELEINSKAPLTELAKRLRISKEAVAYRINKLSKAGILLRCHAIVDMTKLGYETFRIYLKLQNCTSTDKADLFEDLGNNQHVWTTAKLHGKWDVALFIGIKNSTQFHSIWRDIQEKYKGKIAESKIAVYSPIYNFNKRFLATNTTPVVERLSGTHEKGDFDATDEEIIHAYTTDVRQSLVTVAKKCDVSIETVRQRIKKLELAKVIVGYKIDLDLAKIGYQGYRVDFYLNSVKRNKELFEHIKQHKNFYQINESIGGADFETEIVVTDLVQLLEILEEVTKRFKDVVKYFEYFGYTGFPRLSMVAD